ncbi:MAG: sterol desaturase family protein [Hydrogenophaga sp.]
MSPEKFLGLAIPVIFLVALSVESRFAARLFEKVHRWRRTGLIFFSMVLVVGSLAPLLLPMDWFKAHALLNLSPLGLWGVPVGLLVTSFFAYWLHRAEHRFDWLWRAAHQLHHSAPRVDLAGAYFTHPVEVLLKVTLGHTVSIYLLGLTPMVASAVALTSALLSMWQHWNIHTPHWIGYIIPRPESHVLHHARNNQARNFGDLPLWDIVFGTFNNPLAPWSGQVGFDTPRNTRVKDMLLMRDVHNGSHTN